jgi:hypothetical protein
MRSFTPTTFVDGPLDGVSVLSVIGHPHKVTEMILDIHEHVGKYVRQPGEHRWLWQPVEADEHVR